MLSLQMMGLVADVGRSCGQLGVIGQQQKARYKHPGTILKLAARAILHPLLLKVSFITIANQSQRQQPLHGLSGLS